ncbi:DUF6261 family protein [Flaviaesturariibacter aridisoli]|uniref:Uncharacterized protein n=1 Tax=Flaviaesturariibacter aridisoli TaxID=2545761 RepID=A0A4V2WMR8_9BACT|nr:DUF6261 family protein [Flaviaesturariibacter aridisoli]TCZ72247.1 hypothetical protein E0486_09150 [Flaviaesturariibacter aridisoli]
MRSHALHLTPLSNEEFIQFFEQLLASIDNSDAALPAALESAQAGAARIHGEIKALFRRDRAPRHTARMVAADGRRHDLVLGLQELCEGNLYHPDEDLREHAAVLDRRLEAYGPRHISKSYRSETALVAALVRDLREDRACAAAVAALGLGAWVNALDAANLHFDNTFMERAGLDADLDLPYTMIEKRDELRLAYENLLHKLDGFYHTAEGAEPWKRLVRMVDILTQEYREIVHERKGAKVLEGAGSL